jgi:MFS family permease
MVAAVGVALTVISGLSFYNLTVLLKAFVAEGGFSVAVVSGATASFFVASGISGALTGRLIDRFDARITIVFGAVLGAGALASIGAITNVVHLYLFHIAFGAAYGCCGLVPGTTLVARWFERRRSLALSIASTGLSLGGILFTPTSAYWIHQFGLAKAGYCMGAAFLVGVVPITILVMRPSPAAMGLQPDGAPDPMPAPGSAVLPTPDAAEQIIAAAPRGMAFADAIRHPFFIGLLIAYIFALGSQVGAVAHLYRLVSLRGSDALAALAVACMAGASITGRLISGWLLLKMPARGFTLAIVGMQGAGLVFLAFAHSPAALIAGSILFGINLGNVLMMQALLLAERFGTRDYGRIFSICQLGTMTGVAGGPFAVGAIFQITGGYHAAFLAAAGASALGVITLIVADRIARRHDRAASAA